jgi:hypothetical protein
MHACMHDLQREGSMVMMISDGEEESLSFSFNEHPRIATASYRMSRRDTDIEGRI